MHSFQLTSHVNEQGILQIQLPFDFANQEVDIVLAIKPTSNPALLKELVGAFEGEENLSEQYKYFLINSWNKKCDHS